MQLKLPLFLLLISGLTSCSFYKSQTLSNPSKSVQQTNVYLETSRQVYSLNNITFSKKRLSFTMDSVAIPVNSSYDSYKQKGSLGNEVHIKLSDWSLNPGRSVVDDTIFGNYDPNTFARLSFYTPTDYLTLYNADIRRITGQFRVVLFQNGNYHILENSTLSSESISGTLSPGTIDIKALRESNQAGLLLFRCEGVNLASPTVSFPLSSISAIDYQTLDVKRSFLNSAAIGAGVSAVILITLFTTTDLENSDD